MLKEEDKEFETMLRFILLREGGYSNHPLDKGGETNKGITYSTYNAYRRSKNLPIQSVKNITDKEVKDIYYYNYYKASGADKIANPRLALFVFDTAVNMGVSVAKDLFNKCNNNIDKYEELRRAKYKAYVDYDNSQKIFLSGWNNRVSHLRDFAENALPDNRFTSQKLNIETDVDRNDNVIYKYNIDDYRKFMDLDFVKSFPKIFKQIIEKSKYIKNNGFLKSSSECAGVYNVSGYIRSDGVKVSSYERVCGAKHLKN